MKRLTLQDGELVECGFFGVFSRDGIVETSVRFRRSSFPRKIFSNPFPAFFLEKNFYFSYPRRKSGFFSAEIEGEKLFFVCGRASGGKSLHAHHDRRKFSPEKLLSSLSVQPLFLGLHRREGGFAEEKSGIYEFLARSRLGVGASLFCPSFFETRKEKRSQKG